MVCVGDAGVGDVRCWFVVFVFFFQAEDGIRDYDVTGVQTCALPILIAQANRWVFDSIEEKVEQQMGKDRGIALRRDDAGNLLIDLPRTQMNEDVEDVLPQSVLIAPAPTALDQWKMTFDLAIGRYFLLLAWAALFLALLAGAQARAAERRGERLRSAAKAAELRSLRYQVDRKSGV
mgnify:CR=1 FL=1